MGEYRNIYKKGVFRLRCKGIARNTGLRCKHHATIGGYCLMHFNIMMDEDQAVTNANHVTMYVCPNKK